MSPTPLHLRLGTRGSFLARTQSQQVADALLARLPGLTVELVVIETGGDRIQDRPLYEFGGKGLFVKELELALLDKRVDFAVHSYKDVPVTMPLVDQSELTIAAVPERADPGDLLVFPTAARVALRAGDRVGTSSLRRAMQLRALDLDLKIDPLRGNVDTRLRKLRGGEYDAIILAAAGLKRAGLYDASTMVDAGMVPAAGQGALALQCRKDASATAATLRHLHDEPTARCVQAEREVVRLLHGDCHSPIGAFATLTEGTATLSAFYAAGDGSTRRSAYAFGTASNLHTLPSQCVATLLDHNL